MSPKPKTRYSGSTPETTHKNYDDTLSDAVAVPYRSAKHRRRPERLGYFVSDGQPNQPAGSAGISASEQSDLETFLTNNDVVAYALGAGSGVTTSALDPVAFNGVTNDQIPCLSSPTCRSSRRRCVGTVDPVSTSGDLLTDPNPTAASAPTVSFVQFDLDRRTLRSPAMRRQLRRPDCGAAGPRPSRSTR